MDPKINEITNSDLLHLYVEVSDFEERLKNNTSQEEWIIMSNDWLVFGSIGINHAIKDSPSYSSSDKALLRDLILRMRAVKTHILAVGYDYPSEIDGFDFSKLE